MDELPQIRVGSNIQKMSDDEVATYDINTDTVSCEAIINTFNKASPNGVQWFNNQLDSNFELPFRKIPIESDIFNFTSPFNVNNEEENLFIPLENYKCCTTLDNKPIECLTVNLSQNPTTTTPTTTSTYKTTTTQEIITSTNSIIITSIINNSTTHHTTSKSTKTTNYSAILCFCFIFFSKYIFTSL